MMLSTLATVAQSLGLNFQFGYASDFNIAADHIGQDILYHEGFLSGGSTEDQQGAWEPTYTLKLRVMTKNIDGNNTKPIERKPRFELLEALMYRVIRKLEKDFIIVGPVTFYELIGQSDADFDGIRFVVNAKPKVPTLPDCE